jgi:hypothetical protein
MSSAGSEEGGLPGFRFFNNSAEINKKDKDKTAFENRL